MKKQYRRRARRSIRLRAATLEDANRLAQLSTQLGYPSSRMQVARRLRRILGHPEHAVYVATVRDDSPVGWVHVCVSDVVETDPEAEIGGLVVEEGYRGRGVGRALMAQAERWARAKRLASVYLRSNVIRTTAHAFYQRLGYRIVKTQYAFRKKL